MKTVIFLVLLAAFSCNGHLSKLTDILSGAHKHVHETVHGVASSVLGGLNLNFGAHLNVGSQTHHGPPSHQTEQPETVIIVVEKPSDNVIPGSNNGPYGQGQQPNYNQNNPHYPQTGHDLSNQGNYNQNGHYGANHQNQGPNTGFHQNGQNNNEQNFHPHPMSTSRPNSVHNTPTYGSIYNPTEFTQKPDSERNPLDNKKGDKTTSKPTDDGPLLIPLHPNEYVYGGDKINVTSPKRETDNKPAEKDDDNFPIDIRFQDD